MSNNTPNGDLNQIRDRLAAIGSDIDEIINRAETHADAQDLWYIQQRAMRSAAEIDEIIKRRDDELHTKPEREVTEAENGPGKNFCSTS